MSNLLVVVLIVIFTCQSAFCNLYARSYTGKKEQSSSVYSVFYGVIVALFTLLISGFNFHPSAPTIIFGILNGTALTAYNYLMIKSSGEGPYSVLMIINLFGGILIPMFYSIFKDGNSLSVLQYAAIILMLVSLIFLYSTDKPKNSDTSQPNTKLTPKFLILCSLLGISNGIYGTLLSVQKTVAGEQESGEMIIITFAITAAASMVMLILKSGREAFSSFRLNKKAALAVLSASLSAATAVNVLTYCLGLINVAVLYSMNNGGVLALSVLWSVVILGEKLSLKKLLGLAMSVVSIVALSVL